MNGSSVTVESNVTVRCLNKYGRVIRTSNLHNKATTVMVEGLLKFLRGDFNPTKYNEDYNHITCHEANAFIPAELRFGNVGVRIKDPDHTGISPELDTDSNGRFIDYDQIKTPEFEETRLQNEIKFLHPSLGQEPIKFEVAKITSFENSNNSRGLLLRAYIPAGRLVGFYDDERDDEGHVVGRKFVPFTEALSAIEDGEGWVYRNTSTGEYETVFTEIGLYSGDDLLLARVVFDGDAWVNEDSEIIYDFDSNPYNPVVQTQTTSIVVEWRIGIVSLGHDEKIVTISDVPEEVTSAGPDISTVENKDGTVTYSVDLPAGGELFYWDVTDSSGDQSSYVTDTITVPKDSVVRIYCSFDVTM